jgi:CRP-like cAMP-binding protein
MGARPLRAARAPEAAAPRDDGPGRAGDLAPLVAFAAFDPAELADLAGRMCRRTFGSGEVLVAEGDPGGSCFVVVAGLVDVDVTAAGRDERAARLAPGATFGELSLFDAAPRSATVVAHTSATVLEIDRAACAHLFAERSPVALKFLAVLTRGLVTALRHADRRRLRDAREGRDAGDGRGGRGVSC